MIIVHISLRKEKLNVIKKITIKITGSKTNGMPALSATKKKELQGLMKIAEKIPGFYKQTLEELFLCEQS